MRTCMRASIKNNLRNALKCASQVRISMKCTYIIKFSPWQGLYRYAHARIGNEVSLSISMIESMVFILYRYRYGE